MSRAVWRAALAHQPLDIDHEPLRRSKMIVALRSILPAVMLACIGAGQTAAQPICKPALTVKQVGFSEMINLRRVWTASIDVDASRCTTTSGLYSIGFIRLSESAPDLASPNRSFGGKGKSEWLSSSGPVKQFSATGSTT
jgi:hypothetical protein